MLSEGGLLEKLDLSIFDFEIEDSKIGRMGYGYLKDKFPRVRLLPTPRPHNFWWFKLKPVDESYVYQIINFILSSISVNISTKIDIMGSSESQT